jgi:hypothetical protein
VNKIFLLLLLLLCNGCGVWLRYKYEDALSYLPKNTRVLDLNNSYILAQSVESIKYQYIEYIYSPPKIIEYSVVETNIYKFYYGNEGQIYKVERVKK